VSPQFSAPQFRADSCFGPTRLYLCIKSICVCVCVYFLYLCPVLWSPSRDLLLDTVQLSERRVVRRPFLCALHRFIPFCADCLLCCWLATSSSSGNTSAHLTVCVFVFPFPLTRVVWQHLVHRPGIRIPARRPLPRGRRYYWPSKEGLPSSTTISSRCPAVVDTKVPRGRISRLQFADCFGSRLNWPAGSFPFQPSRPSIRTTATHKLLYLNVY
jgi:hypothetical protein